MSESDAEILLEPNGKTLIASVGKARTRISPPKRSSEKKGKS